MAKVAYLANKFPSPAESYVVEEIRELRRRGVEVVACSARRSDKGALDDNFKALAAETLYLQPLPIGIALRAGWLCLRRIALLTDLLGRVLLRGKESPGRRGRALLHTWLGACYALQLEHRGVEHIHVHHGYFASWVAMVAARLLGIPFSMTLHGSDLLLHRAYLDTKLEHCKVCITVSEFNRRFILEHYPAEGKKIIVQRMGVDTPHHLRPTAQSEDPNRCLIILTAGRLHPVKDHAFLLRGCRSLKDRGLDFRCLIAGEGPEQNNLAKLIEEFGISGHVQLLGQLSRRQLDRYYRMCGLFVLTSRSEGIPLVLMEAMAHGKTVLAPDITGIPELVMDCKTGLLYRAGSLEDFVRQIEIVNRARSALGPLRLAAREHVLRHFDRKQNLAAFGDLFLARMLALEEPSTDADPVLQQI